MEVSIKNAFLICVMMTWRTCTGCLEKHVIISFQNCIYMLIIISLENPLSTTLILSSCSFFLFLLLTLSFLILIGVICVLTAIIACEGFICLVFLVVIGFLSYIILLFLVSMHGMHLLITHNDFLVQPNNGIE